MEFILGLVKIKKAAAIANVQAKNFSPKIGRAIVRAAQEILAGKHHDQFPLSSFQGGAGTAINMNVNEVIAGRATEILNGKIVVHPNDHVNRSQSTNDVNPSAIKIAAYGQTTELVLALNSLIKAFEYKGKSFAKIIKLGRTHMQDAVPTTLGAEFLAYASVLKEHVENIVQAAEKLLELNLGGTAIGNSVNASPVYIAAVYKALNKITKQNFVAAKNLMAKTSDQSGFLVVSQAVTALAASLSKIANDFKFMSSGPRGGIGEIILPELQKGSSIMPGKVNPVMPETLNQLYFLVSGNNLTIEKAVEAAQMELNVMLPVIADRLLESISLITEAVIKFEKFCVLKLKVDAAKCKKHLENSTALATFLTPKFGYDKISQLVKLSVAKKTSFKEEVINSGIMKTGEWEQLVKKVIQSLI